MYYLKLKNIRNVNVSFHSAFSQGMILKIYIFKQIRTLTPKEQLVLRLEKQYPDDVGVLSAFFFNYIKLAPVEALYLDANEPHAYLYGECVECWLHQIMLCGMV